LSRCNYGLYGIHLYFSAMRKNHFPDFVFPFIIFILIHTGTAFSQNFPSGNVSGNFQSDAQYYQNDPSINAVDVPQKFLANSFFNLNYQSDIISAGLRYESYLDVLRGYDPRYKGNGIGYRYVGFHKEGLEVTAGNFYEQFGNGLIFRTYEDWSLGYDNSLDGVRVKYSPFKGIYMKAVIGRQRLFFDYGPGIARGGDLEVNVSELHESLSKLKTKVIFGGSFLSKYQVDADPIYKLPENVGAFSGRLNISRGNVSLGGEFAHKINDPSAINNYIYKEGQALLLTAAYSKKGFGLSVSAKRIDNMNFRSDRTTSGNILMLNYLPSLTKQNTYQLATYYPYATQPNGEMGIQAGLDYKLKAGSVLGGFNGTHLSINISGINMIDTISSHDGYGYRSDFFKPGKQSFYREINILIERKLNKSFWLKMCYMYLGFNKDVIQGVPGFGFIKAHTGIVEVRWQINGKNSIRTEMQNMYTKQDKGSWAMGLLEYSVSPHWFINLFDNYNYGNQLSKDRLHYFSASAGYTRNANRISMGYGRQREGILCVGGICRNVPASNGFTLSISGSF
jgi:hypothetical protein